MQRLEHALAPTAHVAHAADNLVHSLVMLNIDTTQARRRQALLTPYIRVEQRSQQRSGEELARRMAAHERETEGRPSSCLKKVRLRAPRAPREPPGPAQAARTRSTRPPPSCGRRRRAWGLAWKAAGAASRRRRNIACERFAMQRGFSSKSGTEGVGGGAGRGRRKSREQPAASPSPVSSGRKKGSTRSRWRSKRAGVAGGPGKSPREPQGARRGQASRSCLAPARSPTGPLA